MVLSRSSLQGVGWGLGTALLLAAGCSEVTVIENPGTASPGGGGSTTTTSHTGGSAGIAGQGGGTGLAGGAGAMGGTGGGGGTGLAGGGGATGGSGGGSPTCGDGVQNGTESDVDCGGAECPPCADCSSCVVAGDCASGGCDPVSHVCTPLWIDVATGDWHTCGRQGDGTLWCWGRNDRGQLGTGVAHIDEPSPVQVTALGTSATEIALGMVHSCARLSDGTLWCWGSNQHGELGTGANGDSHFPVAITALGSSVASVALGGQHSCALATDGSLWCWGENADGELGDGTTVDQPVPVPITALGTEVAQAALGMSHSCALATDGSLWCWGSNHRGELGDGTHVGKSSPVQVTALGNAVAEIALGGEYTCARKTDGTLWCWGYGHNGELGNGTGVGSQSPVQVTALGNAVAEVALDQSHTCARKTDGSLWCWGNNGDWQLGDGTQTPTLSPIAVTALGTSVARVALGEGFSCALEADGSLWCWGFNWNGNLGDGTHVDEHWPARVPAVACP